MLKRNIQFYLIDLLLLAAIFGGGGFYYWRLNHESSSVADAIVGKINEQNCESRRKIDGACIDGKTESFVYAAMIDNMNVARPAYGLSRASLVYEAIAEAPITRFIAFFSGDEKIDRIGPVRSTRPYYVDWVKEINGVYSHVGGSPDALMTLLNYDFDLNEFTSNEYFWRSDNHLAPHNVFTSSDLVLKAIEEKNWQLPADFGSWIFKPDAAMADRPEAQTVSVDFANPVYNVKWEYGKETNDYLRSEGGVAQKDADNGAEIRAKNVAVMYVSSRVIDAVGRRSTKTIGGGEAVVFQDGKATTGTWKRDGLNSRTRFFDDAGKEISFNAGTTWIEAVPGHFPKVSW
ncbi:MAG: DUF3048 domain-containing protein [Parcubacteria group bacterium]